VSQTGAIVENRRPASVPDNAQITVTVTETIALSVAFAQRHETVLRLLPVEKFGDIIHPHLRRPAVAGRSSTPDRWAWTLDRFQLRAVDRSGGRRIGADIGERRIKMCLVD
jgi:hypothetical protein